MGATAAAIMIRKERDVVERFLFSGATSEAGALTLNELGIDSDFALRRLQDRAVIRETSRGTFYIDELSWHAMRKTRRARVIGLLIVILVLVGFVFATRVVPNRVDTRKEQVPL